MFMRNFIVGKKTYTVKNLVIIDTKEQIKYLAETVQGKIHDKRLAEQLDSVKHIRLLGDFGFYGYKNTRITIKTPHKKSKERTY